MRLKRNKPLFVQLHVKDNTMNIATTYTRTCIGLDAHLVRVETHISPGLPAFSIVGLAQTAVKESKDRVRSALLNSLYELPARKITINLAPAALPKVGSGFDLAIAIGILVASKQINPTDIESYEWLAELGLNGEIHPVNGVLAAVIANQKTERKLVLAQGCHQETVITESKNLLFADSLLSVTGYLSQKTTLPKLNNTTPKTVHKRQPCLSDIHGQENGKRALIIAAAGKHSLLFSGPPGCGKTMLASRLSTILPPLAKSKAVETASIYSLKGPLSYSHNWSIPPFRAPHHCASFTAITGGGNPIQPGELSLSHNGVLFLDELPEFERKIIEALREPLEEKKITIARAGQHLTFPADFQLIAALNPCPCGQLGNHQSYCQCTPAQIERYIKKLSGPFLDRVDLCIELQPLPKSLMFKPAELNHQHTSEKLQKIIMRAQEVQLTRQSKLNANLTTKETETLCKLQPDVQTYFERALSTLKLSMRSFHRVLRVARTIADLVNSQNIEQSHLGEALTYRSKLFKN